MKLYLALILLLITTVTYSQVENKATQVEQNFTVGKYVVKYIVENRKAMRLPKIDIMSDVHGTVAIDITIDKYGNVTIATPNQEKTTTKSSYLITKSKQAAETTHFDTTPTTPLKTKGIMVFTY